MAYGGSGGKVGSADAALKGDIPPKPVATACPGAAAVSGAAATVGGTVAGAVDADGDPAITTPGAVGTAGASAAGAGGNAGGDATNHSSGDARVVVISQEARKAAAITSGLKANLLPKAYFAPFAPLWALFGPKGEQPASVLDLKKSRVSTERTSSASESTNLQSRRR